MAEPKGGVEGKSVGEGSAAPPDEFRRFLVALAVDPAKLGAFLKDPDEVMKAAGISDVDRIILKSGYPAAIHARLSGQKLAFTPAVAIPALVVDLVRPPEGAEGEAQPVVRTSGQWAQPAPWSVAMYPNIPLPIFPQVQPQIFPQVHPQLVIHPQIYPQIHPIFPQVHPLVYPQVSPYGG
ncbi:MAG TPA: hypothetical protein VKE22_25170 [Haliangiales bacterium]|nr:hypothetical protein [Haliangiales bacterium]